MKDAGVAIWDALRDLVPLVQSKKREKHPWMSATFCRLKGCVRYIFTCFVCLIESTRKTMENVFHFTSKALFILEIIKS